MKELPDSSDGTLNITNLEAKINIFVLTRVLYGQGHEPHIWKTLFGRICTIVSVIGYAPHDSLISTSQFVKIIEQGQRFQVQSLEVTSYRNR